MRGALRTAAEELQSWLREWDLIRRDWSALRVRTEAHLRRLSDLSRDLRAAGIPPARRSDLEEVRATLQLLEADVLWRRILRASPEEAVLRANLPAEEARRQEAALQACATLRQFYAQEMARLGATEAVGRGVQAAEQEEAGRLRKGLARLDRLSSLFREWSAFI